jgi:hypothetical protein
MLKMVVLVYLWLVTLIMIRYWYLSRLSNKEATYRLESSELQAPKVIYWICITALFCFWPILLLAYPTDFVGAFIFNKKANLNFLLFRMGKIAGFTVGMVSQLFK